MVWAYRGIVAGSSFATTELRLLLLTVTQSMQKCWPRINLSLFVDDATLEVEDDQPTMAAAELAAATDWLVDAFQTDLKLEVSPSKSVVIASMLGLAKTTARISRCQALRAQTHGKLLGVDSCGGRRRRVTVLKHRLKNFKQHKRRYHRLRGAGVDVRRVVAATASPQLTYGAEVTGIADTHLQHLRTSTAAAMAAATAGKSSDAVLYLADASGSTLADPAYFAHILPIATWANAIWHNWAPRWLMAKALGHAQGKVLQKDATASSDTNLGDALAPNQPHHSHATPHSHPPGSSSVTQHQHPAATPPPQPRWQLVVGPAGAVIASLARLGWRALPNHALYTDTHKLLDMLLDPPAVIKHEVKQAVRRWQHKQLAAQLLHLVPSEPDAHIPSPPGTPSQDHIIDLGGNLHKLVFPKGSSQTEIPSCPLWQTKHRAPLRSAIVGGQWPQYRLMQAKWTDDPRCQLCQAHPGTLTHRFQCPATLPPNGWPAIPITCLGLHTQLHADRRRLLQTRGLLALRIRLPTFQSHATLTWHLDPRKHEQLDDATWYIDGSMFDGKHQVGTRCGYGIVVVTQQAQLIGLASGTTPHWINDAAGAELWAYHLVLLEQPVVPRTCTDCKGILDGTHRQPQALTAATSMLARTWAMILHTLDDDLRATHGKLVWIPAHISAARMQQHPPCTSESEPMSWIQWRANRLADLLAKTAASRHRLPAHLFTMFQKVDVLHKHQAALLGVVTHVANNHMGANDDTIRRDSAGQRPRGPRTWRRFAPQQHQAAPAASSTSATSSTAGTASNPRQETQHHPSSRPLLGKEKRRRQTKEHEQAQALVDARRVANHLAISTLQTNANQATATERLAALRERIRAKEAEDAAWAEERRQA